MESTKFQVLATRFMRGFVYTFLGVVVPILLLEINKGYDLSSPLDRNRLFTNILTPVIVGLLLAIDKWIRWVEPEKPVEIDALTDADLSKPTSFKAVAGKRKWNQTNLDNSEIRHTGKLNEKAEMPTLRQMNITVHSAELTILKINITNVDLTTCTSILIVL